MHKTSSWQGRVYKDLANRNLHILGALKGQSGFGILPFEKWDKFNTVSIKNCTSHLSTFTYSFIVSDGGQDASSGLGLGRTEVTAPFRQYQKNVTGKAIHITLVSLKWEGVITLSSSMNTSLGCPRERDMSFEGHVMLLGGGAEKGRANKANMRDGFKRLYKLSQINSWKKCNY